MSSSLKERLKRCSRSHSSPLTKCILPSSPVMCKPHELSTSFKSDPATAVYPSPSDNILNETIVPKSKEEIEEVQDKCLLLQMYCALNQSITANKEKIRKLKLVLQHHNENKPEALEALIQRWVIAAQESLSKLHEILPEPKPQTFQGLISHLQIDPDVIKYNSEKDSFA
ncbi:swi5-dependent recombination DNA repair protein 1 homolog isoform X2 [Stegodyphus dumicola]|nr:swi5-dependent recombination DNA repair protein 1 homolog isoform X2 [Stegodyphus dumicola]